MEKWEGRVLEVDDEYFTLNSSPSVKEPRSSRTSLPTSSPKTMRFKLVTSCTSLCERWLVSVVPPGRQQFARGAWEFGLWKPK